MKDLTLHASNNYHKVQATEHVSLPPHFIDALVKAGLLEATGDGRYVEANKDVTNTFEGMAVEVKGLDRAED